MTFGQKLAFHIAPVFLRLALGVTFLWAGLGKLIPEDFQISPQNASALVDMGAVEAAKVQGFLDLAQPDGETTSEESSPDNDTPSDPVNPGESDEAGPGDTDDDNGGGSASTQDHAIVLAQGGDSDDDLPELKRLFEVAVMVAHAAKPTAAEDGTARSALLPTFMGDGATPKYLGWATAIAEVFVGGFLLIGFMARLSGLVAAGIMAMAMWLTQIGPAAMGHVPAKLGFLPFPESQSLFDTGFYAQLGWQLALFAGALALLFSGAGVLSLDRILFGSSKNDDFDED